MDQAHRPASSGTVDNERVEPVASVKCWSFYGYIARDQRLSCLPMPLVLDRHGWAVPPRARTHGARLPVLRGHHQRRLARVVGRVHLGAVSQQELQALHVVRKGCGVQRRPGGGTSGVSFLGTSHPAPCTPEKHGRFTEMPTRPLGRVTNAGRRG